MAAPTKRVLVLATTFDEDQQRLLEELERENEQAASRLAGVLKDSGVDGLTSAVRTQPAWTQDEPAVFWRIAGRVLLAAGRLSDAERAFVRETETPGAADIVAAHTAAARIAEADGRSDDADRHLSRACEAGDEHPLISLFEAARAPTPRERLELCDAVEPRTDSERARQESERAHALLDLGRFAEALDAANKSLELWPHGDGRELATLATIWLARERLPARDRDDRPLIAAVRYQLSLHERKLAQGNRKAAAAAGARAALGTAILGDLRAVGEAIDRVLALDEALEVEEARSTLLTAAVVTGDAQRAERLLPDDEGPKAKIARAHVLLLAGAATEAATLLDEALAELEPGEIHDEARRLRVSAAGDPQVELDPSLAAGLPDAEPLLAGALAERALAQEDVAAARQHLAGFDDTPSLALRVEIAEADGAFPEAVGLQAALTRRLPTTGNLLRLAALRARAGDFPGAMRDAMRLATDERKLPSARDHAFGIAAQAAIDGADFEELEDIADRWGELSPERADPPWAEVFALARQHRHAEALDRARRRGLQPVEEANRHLLIAELYRHGIADAAERLAALRDLSDQFGRPRELEQAFIGAVLATPDSERPDDEQLVARFQEALSTFQERFPESGAITAISIEDDDDGEAIIAKLATLQGADEQEAVDARQEAIDGVKQARFPIAFLAAMVGRSTAETIIRNGAHPLGVFDAATHQEEVSAAQEALDAAAAVFDETACVTVGLLGDQARASVLAALPNAVTGQTVIDSLAEAVGRQMGGEQVATMHVLPDGTPRIVEEDPQTVRRAREAELAAHGVAERLAVAADRALGDDRLAAMVAGASGRPPAAAATGALALARHGGQKLYSDDRVLRAFARAFGLRSFGTIALVEALLSRELIDRERADEMLREIIDLGVWSLALDPASYVDAARRADFELGRVGRALLADELILRVDPRVTHNALLLAVIAEEAPAKLETWAQMIVLGYREMLALEPLFSASLLLAAQFSADVEQPDATLRARNSLVARALRSAEGLDGAHPDSDPLLGALRRWLSVTKAADRDHVLKRMLAQIDEELAAQLRPQLEDDDPPAEPDNAAPTAS